MRKSAFAALMVLVVAQAAPASADPSYPSKPITIVSHTNAGGGMDLFAREVAKLLSPILGVPVVIENRSGGSSAVAVQYVTSRPADGYTLIGLTDTLIITPIKNRTPKSVKDLTPVASMVTDPNVLFVLKNSKYETAKQLIDEVKGGSRVRVGTPQSGSPERLAVDLLIKDHGLKGIVPVPFESGAEGLTAVLGGHVAASIAEPAEIAAQLEAGEVRVLATFTTKRMPRMPDVPTFNELGYPVAIDKFRGFAAPKGTPKPVVEKLAAALKKVLEHPDYKPIYDRNYQIPDFIAGQEIEAFVAAKEARYGKHFKR